MTRKIVPFRHWHYDWLPDYVTGQERFIGKQELEALDAQNSWTAVYDGNVVACAGTVQQWPGRHFAWAFMGRNTGRHMLWLTRAVKEKTAHLQGRIDFTVRVDFGAGHKWAQLLGFKAEALFEKWGPEGESHIQYVRFQ